MTTASGNPTYGTTNTARPAWASSIVITACPAHAATAVMTRSTKPRRTPRGAASNATSDGRATTAQTNTSHGTAEPSNDSELRSTRVSAMKTALKKARTGTPAAATVHGPTCEFIARG